MNDIVAQNKSSIPSIDNGEAVTPSLNTSSHLRSSLLEATGSKLRPSVSIEMLRPKLTQGQKIASISALIELLADDEFQASCAKTCKDSGSKFPLKALEGELTKAVGIFQHYLEEVENGEHNYSTIHGNNIVARQAYGRIVGFSAPNYPIGENAAVIGVLNAILAGCPMDLRMGAASTAAVDRLMADRVIQTLKGIVPDGFIGKVDITHENSKEVLSKYAGIFFIGGSAGASLIEHTQYKIGNLQTGRPNWMIIMDDYSDKGAELLVKAMQSRFGLSCSAPSIVFVENDSDILTEALIRSGELIKSELIKSGESPIPDDRFMKSLNDARDVYVRGGGTLLSKEGDYLTIVKMSMEDFARLKSAGTVPEMFGPGILLVENIHIPTVPHPRDPGDLNLLPHAKTGIVVGEINEAFRVASACDLLAGRISVNEGSSTPGPGASYVHKNINGRPEEMVHIIAPKALLGPKEVYILPKVVADSERPYWN